MMKEKEALIAEKYQLADKVNTLRKQSKAAEEKWEREKESLEKTIADKSSALADMKTEHDRLEGEITRLKVLTSNVTGRHRGPKRKLRARLQSAVTTTAGLVTERRHQNGRHMLRCVFIVECGIAHFLCAMRVFEVRTSSSSPSLPLCQISFISRPPLLR